MDVGVAEPQDVSGSQSAGRVAGAASGAAHELPAGVPEGVGDLGGGDERVAVGETVALLGGGDGGGGQVDGGGVVHGDLCLVLRISF